MSEHKDWSSTRKVKRCTKLTIEGHVCGKPLGQCIHSFQPTRMGAQ